MSSGPLHTRFLFELESPAKVHEQLVALWRPLMTDDLPGRQGREFLVPDLWHDGTEMCASDPP
jgi:hypothetical protein